jgi:hypothetical protein
VPLLVDDSGHRLGAAVVGDRRLAAVRGEVGFLDLSAELGDRWVRATRHDLNLSVAPGGGPGCYSSLAARWHPTGCATLALQRPFSSLERFG